MTHSIQVLMNWGDDTPSSNVEQMAGLASRLAERMMKGVSGIHYHEVHRAALQFVFNHGPMIKEAARRPNTKDRRDAFRSVFDTVSAEMHVTGYGNLFTPEPPRGSPASIRNKLTQENLVFAATGLLSHKAIEDIIASSGAAEANKWIAECMALDDFGLLVNGIISKFNGYSTAGSPIMVEFEFDDDWNMVAVNPVGAPVATPTTTAAAPAKGTSAMSAVVSNTTVATAIANDVFSKVDPVVAGFVDNSLKQLGLPAINEIGSAFKELAAKAGKGGDGLTIKMGEGMEYKAPASGAIPNGKAVTKKAHEVFGLTGSAAKPFNIDVPVYSWDAPHPFVPAVDEGYQFQPQQLLAVLVAIVTDQRTWLYGDTGCGKTTVIEQVAARLGYPVVRVNFDSEITRMDLIGAKDIVVSGGHPITTFTEGVLPQAMQMPCIFLADELDFIRADVAYVFQRALEGNGLTLPEDAGRVVRPHPGFRIFATANTQGQGDETGRYQGAKPQSAAFLDRFTMWIGCDYMNDDQVKEMLGKKYPSLPTSAIKTLAGYAREHWTAFKNGQVLTALSPRGLLSCAMTYTVYASVIDEKKAMAQAMQSTFLDRASKEDAQTIKGLISRVIS